MVFFKNLAKIRPVFLSLPSRCRAIRKMVPDMSPLYEKICLTYMSIAVYRSSARNNGVLKMSYAGRFKFSPVIQKKKKLLTECSAS